MTRRNGNKIKPFRHINVLIPSQPDHYAMAKAVEQRFLELCHSWLRIRGVELPIPESLNADMLRWRQMRVRHKSGDFRHTEAEWSSVKAFAQWTLDMNADLRNQPRKVLEELK